MAGKPFDVTMKDLVEEFATAWPELVKSGPFRSVEVKDADISTVTGAADKVVLVHGQDYDWMLNLEVQASHKSDVPDRLHLNSTALYRRHGLLVHSVAVLLRREANASNLTGLCELRFPDENTPYDVFRYQVVRVWELPVERLLTGNLGLLPLAPLSDQAAEQLPVVVGRIEARLRRESTPETADKIRSSAFILMGLRYSDEVIQRLYAGVTSMEESVTYQAIVSKGEIKGEIKEARKLLLRLGSKQFGAADAATTAAIESINDLQRLEALHERLLEVSSWQELLGKRP